MRQFDYFKPDSYEKAFALLKTPGKKVMVIAGGTDVIPHTRDGAWQPDAVVDIKYLPGMRSIEIVQIDPSCGCIPGECLFVGAAVRMNEIKQAELLIPHWLLLQQAAGAMGNEQVRNRATIGGNICTASPAADIAPALLTMDAKVLIRSAAGDRCLDIQRFFVSPKVNALQSGEIVVGLLIPKPAVAAYGHFEKLSRRKAGDLSIVSTAVLALRTDTGIQWRLALGAVAPTPIRAYESERILNQSVDVQAIDQAAASAYGCCCPISDIRSSIEYRQAMVVNITRRAIQAVLAKINGGSNDS
ncbi:MAG: xanthine dehydrogenase family protein subunit M [Anaerolineae bacterium]|nr:xanthine dehydrogenase family protein subunit M [Anaerolineae bacterium]